MASEGKQEYSFLALKISSGSGNLPRVCSDAFKREDGHSVQHTVLVVMSEVRS